MNFWFLIGFFVVSGLGLLFWRDSLGAREQARAASARACQQMGVQLLDDTVALERLYVFEFTDTGQRRQVGSVLLVGWRVEVLHMEGGDLLVP